MKGPLSGYRIVDLSRAIAGPYGSMILGDLGAEVIKVEAPGNDFHTNVPGPNIGGESFYYLAFNRNKKDVALDLGTKLGREAFYDLVKISDVVWDNFRAGVPERLGTDYESVKKINPRIISCSITGYGPTGPYSLRASNDIIALSLSGIMSITGEPGRPPVKPGVAITDLAAGAFAALGVCAALAHRERTGEGQKVDIALLDTCISLLAYELTYYLLSGIVPGPMGSGHLGLVPYGVYKCKDGYITIAPSWPRLARVIGAEWMINDPRFKTAADRVAHREEFVRILEEHLAQATASDWLELFYAEDIRCAPINNIAEAAALPQVAHRHMILSLNHSLGGELKLAGNPIKMPIIDESEYIAPPTLGQHDMDILGGLLGYSDEKIKRLKEEEKEHQEELKLRLEKRNLDPATRLLMEQQEVAREE